jgi:hypothetical protein
MSSNNENSSSSSSTLQNERELNHSVLVNINPNSYKKSSIEQENKSPQDQNGTQFPFSPIVTNIINSDPNAVSSIAVCKKNFSIEILLLKNYLFLLFLY